MSEKHRLMYLGVACPGAQCPDVRLNIMTEIPLDNQLMTFDRSHRLSFYVFCDNTSDHIRTLLYRKMSDRDRTYLGATVKWHNRSSSLDGRGLTIGVLASSIGCELSSFASYFSLCFLLNHFGLNAANCHIRCLINTVSQ